MSEKKYKCIFFDLDHTLWDYETNSRETLAELYYAYDLHNKGVFNLDEFQRQFRKVNTELWDLYDRGIITSEVIRQERFKRILDYFHAYEDKLSKDLSADYLYNCPKKANLMPHAIDVLEYLAAQYTLTLVTNGFEEIQNLKLTAGNLHRFFNHIITSQKAGARKPSPGIFEYAMNVNSIKCCDAIMIGDNLVTDIGGARGASIDTVFFNPERIPHTAAVSHEIFCLSELPKIL
jgi:YjjG family noncanonical pyrimidine nucleotidase